MPLYSEMYHNYIGNTPVLPSSKIAASHYTPPSYVGISRGFTNPITTTRTPSFSRGYIPKLTPITETPLKATRVTALTRVNSPKFTPTHSSPTYQKPRRVINTADIDVSASRYGARESAPKWERYLSSSPTTSASTDSNNNTIVSAREQELIERNEQRKARSAINRNRTVVRLNTIRARSKSRGSRGSTERKSPRQSETEKTFQEEMLYKEPLPKSTSWRDQFREEIPVRSKKAEPIKSPGELLLEKHLIRDEDGPIVIEEIILEPPTIKRRATIRRKSAVKIPSFHEICSDISSDRLDDDLNAGELRRRASQIIEDEIAQFQQELEITNGVMNDNLGDRLKEAIEQQISDSGVEFSEKKKLKKIKRTKNKPLPMLDAEDNVIYDQPEATSTAIKIFVDDATIESSVTPKIMAEVESIEECTVFKFPKKKKKIVPEGGDESEPKAVKKPMKKTDVMPIEQMAVQAPVQMVEVVIVDKPDPKKALSVPSLRTAVEDKFEQPRPPGDVKPRPPESKEPSKQPEDSQNKVKILPKQPLKSAEKKTEQKETKSAEANSVLTTEKDSDQKTLQEKDANTTQVPKKIVPKFQRKNGQEDEQKQIKPVMTIEKTESKTLGAIKIAKDLETSTESSKTTLISGTESNSPTTVDQIAKTPKDESIVNVGEQSGTKSVIPEPAGTGDKKTTLRQPTESASESVPKTTKTLDAESAPQKQPETQTEATAPKTSKLKSAETAKPTKKVEDLKIPDCINANPKKPIQQQVESKTESDPKTPPDLKSKIAPQKQVTSVASDLQTEATAPKSPIVKVAQPLKSAEKIEASKNPAEVDTKKLAQKPEETLKDDLSPKKQPIAGAPEPPAEATSPKSPKPKIAGTARAWKKSEDSQASKNSQVDTKKLTQEPIERPKSDPESTKPSPQTTIGAPKPDSATSKPEPNKPDTSAIDDAKKPTQAKDKPKPALKQPRKKAPEPQKQQPEEEVDFWSNIGTRETISFARRKQVIERRNQMVFLKFNETGQEDTLAPADETKSKMITTKMMKSPPPKESEVVSMPQWPKPEPIEEKLIELPQQSATNADVAVAKKAFEVTRVKNDDTNQTRDVKTVLKEVGTSADKSPEQLKKTVDNLNIKKPTKSILENSIPAKAPEEKLQKITNLKVAPNELSKPTSEATTTVEPVVAKQTEPKATDLSKTITSEKVATKPSDLIKKPVDEQAIKQPPQPALSKPVPEKAPIEVPPKVVSLESTTAPKQTEPLKLKPKPSTPEKPPESPKTPPSTKQPIPDPPKSPKEPPQPQTSLKPLEETTKKLLTQKLSPKELIKAVAPNIAAAAEKKLAQAKKLPASTTPQPSPPAADKTPPPTPKQEQPIAKQEIPPVVVDPATAAKPTTGADKKQPLPNDEKPKPTKIVKKVIKVVKPKAASAEAKAKAEAERVEAERRKAQENAEKIKAKINQITLNMGVKVEVEIKECAKCQQATLSDALPTNKRPKKKQQQAVKAADKQQDQKPTDGGTLTKNKFGAVTNLSDLSTLRTDDRLVSGQVSAGADPQKKVLTKAKNKQVTQREYSSSSSEQDEDESSETSFSGIEDDWSSDEEDDMANDKPEKKKFDPQKRVKLNFEHMRKCYSKEEKSPIVLVARPRPLWKVKRHGHGHNRKADLTSSSSSGSEDESRSTSDRTSTGTASTVDASSDVNTDSSARSSSGQKKKQVKPNNNKTSDIYDNPMVIPLHTEPPSSKCSTKDENNNDSNQNQHNEEEDENNRNLVNHEIRSTSTSSHDSGFYGGGTAPISPKKALETSYTYAQFQKTGKLTAPATIIPRFRKYNVDDFHFLTVLGKGSFGKVFLAELRNTEYYYAVKCLKKDVVLEDDDVDCTLIERKVLALGTKHPFLCHLFCTFQTDSHLFFVMEYLNGGDLMFHIQQSGRFTECRARFYAAEIMSGLKFLHRKGIVYRDLKLDNVLLDYDGHVRIADFGMCKLEIYLDRLADSFCGTPDYMAPEIIKGQKYNQAVDWWSFGVLVYEMLVGQSPFSGCDEDELFWSICNEIPWFPHFLSKEALKLLQSLLEKDASIRLGCLNTIGEESDLKYHSFFESIDWHKLERRGLDPPFKPQVRHPLDTQYFDKQFTRERARLTPIDRNILASMNQAQFEGFTYTNPNNTLT